MQILQGRVAGVAGAASGLTDGLYKDLNAAGARSCRPRYCAWA
jgi:hypothetical protein